MTALKVLTTLATAATAVVVVPAAVVRGVIALRTNYEANCATDAWMSADFRQWADELRRAS